MENQKSNNNIPQALVTKLYNVFDKFTAQLNSTPGIERLVPAANEIAHRSAMGQYVATAENGLAAAVALHDKTLQEFKGYCAKVINDYQLSPEQRAVAETHVESLWQQITESYFGGISEAREALHNQYDTAYGEGSMRGSKNSRRLRR